MHVQGLQRKTRYLAHLSTKFLFRLSLTFDLRINIEILT